MRLEAPFLVHIAARLQYVRWRRYFHQHAGQPEQSLRSNLLHQVPGAEGHREARGSCTSTRDCEAECMWVAGQFPKKHHTVSRSAWYPGQNHSTRGKKTHTGDNQPQTKTYVLGLVSWIARTPAATSDAVAVSAVSLRRLMSPSQSGCFAGGGMTTTTTWVGAMRGGSTRPVSSECTMTMTPIVRVVNPHEFCHTS